MSNYIIFIFVVIVLFIALVKHVDAYSAFVDGVSKAMKLFMNIYPSLLSILIITALLKHTRIPYFLENIFPNISSDIFFMILFRPFSGNASLAILIDIMKKYGGDHLMTIMGSAIQGATDTTFYVIALYYGSIQVKKTGDTIFFCLLADIVAILLGIFLVAKFF